MKYAARYLNFGSSLVRIDAKLLEDRTELRLLATFINKIYAQKLREGTGAPKESEFDIAIRKYRPSTFKKILKANPGMARAAARKAKG